MIELVVDRLKRSLDLGKVHHPAAVFAQLTTQMQFDLERMPVQARAFVAWRYIRQPVRGLESENFENIHIRIVTVARVGVALTLL